MPEITNLKFAQRLEEGSISIFNVNNTPISLRFWDGGVENQYINFINDGSVKVTKDTSEFNEVRFNNYRLTLDSGGPRIERPSGELQQGAIANPAGRKEISTLSSTFVSDP